MTASRMSSSSVLLLLSLLGLSLILTAAHGARVPREDKNDEAAAAAASEVAAYSCFPFIFNPGCTLNRYVDWDWVCRTNTLGWEQCDLNKREAETAEVRGAEAEEEHEDEENQTLPEVVYVAQAGAKEIIQSALEEAQE